MTQNHFLHYLFNEDEAEMTGYKFAVTNDQVVVTATYHFPEYEDYAGPRVMNRAAARKLWKELIQTGRFEPVETR